MGAALNNENRPEVHRSSALLLAMVPNNAKHPCFPETLCKTHFVLETVLAEAQPGGKGLERTGSDIY